MPFLGAYAVRVQSLAAAEALLQREAMSSEAVPMRRIGGALVVPFPSEVGLGAWLFVENGRDLPWRG